MYILPLFYRYLYITGRSKEIINKGGEVISPSEVEDAIMTTAGDLVKACFSLPVYAFFILRSFSVK